MNAIAKFIINRNDIIYMYTEKYETLYGLRYFVYDENKINIYQPDTFHDTFCCDHKMSLRGGIHFFEKELLTSSLDDPEKKLLYDKFNIVNNKIDYRNVKNPNLNGTKRELLSMLFKYNNIMNVPKDELDYERDCQILNINPINNLSVSVDFNDKTYSNDNEKVVFEDTLKRNESRIRIDKQDIA